MSRPALSEAVFIYGEATDFGSVIRRFEPFLPSLSRLSVRFSRIQWREFESLDSPGGIEQLYAKNGGSAMPKPEKLLPLPQAAQRLGISPDVLTRLIDSGTIKANVHQGEILVPESQVAQTITREQFAKLKGAPITMHEASEKYGVSVQTIRNWAKRDHLIEILDDSYPTKLDESGVAYCVAVYKARGKSSRIFDKAGLPYQLKHPGLADYRRRKAEETGRVHA